MHGLLRCLLYTAALGAAGFVAGRILARRPCRFDVFPYRDYPFEKGGHFYRKFRIHCWQSRVPDMSRLFPRLMPAKRLTHRITAAEAERMVRETCVAESVHALLCLAGLGDLWLWPGWGGFAVWLVYVLFGNLPFIMIQRFNRPKLIMLMDKCRRAEANRAHRASQT